MTADEKRKLVRDTYKEIIGRNDYSQAKRDYCFKKYSNGKYYSDCSSSVSYSYKKALPNENFGVLNTVGMYNCAKFTQVPVKISQGQITNPEILRIGDMLLYAGSDSGRASSGYVGHVEMVGEISAAGKVTLYGHGSGKPKKTEMTAKNKSRYNSKTSTKLGNKGLIRVMRFIQDNDQSNAPVTPSGTVKVKAGTWNIRKGPSTDYAVIATVKGGTVLELVEMKDWAYIKAGNLSGYISKKALED